MALACQSGQQVVELGEFNLDLALIAAGSLGEDVQDELGAVDHRRVHVIGEIALLGWGQLIIEDDDAVLIQHFSDLESLAASDEGARFGLRAPLDNGFNNVQAGIAGQLGKFSQAVLHLPVALQAVLKGN